MTIVSLLLALLSQGRPTLVVYNFTIEPRSGQAALLTDAASRATRHLVLALAKDSTIQLVQRSVAQRLRNPGSATGPAARFAIVGATKPASKNVRIVWQLLSVVDLRIVVKDSLDAEPGTEGKAAILIAQRVSGALQDRR